MKITRWTRFLRNNGDEHDRQSGKDKRPNPRTCEVACIKAEERRQTKALRRRLPPVKNWP